ncbi:MAG TPA: phosphate signaling complex protein PhoU [Adhaeribacter sp.]|nr:phosphate signaling complex protein PhoU [Adhaeribacter sp.]
MNQLEKELNRITIKVSKMWDAVIFQVVSGKEALVKSDYALAKKVSRRGKKVNKFDVKIDRLVENFFAIFNPVAVDLRWALAILKINANLERIGDAAESVALLIREIETPLNPKLVEATRLIEMYDAAIQMLHDVHEAYDEKDTKKAYLVLQKDELLNTIYRNTDAVLIQYIRENPNDVAHALKVSAIIRKLERIGDQITNISEEIIFYVDAKVIKHAKVRPAKSLKNNGQNSAEN